MQYLNPPQEGDQMSGIPLGLAFLCYGIMAMALHVETGSAHAGLSWPLFAAISGLVAGVVIDRKYIGTE